MARITIAAALVAFVGTGLALAQSSAVPPVILGYRIYLNGSTDPVVDQNHPANVVRAMERDRIRIEVDVQVQTQGSTQPDEQPQAPELYYEKISTWIPYDFSPEGPSIDGDTAENYFLPLVPYDQAPPDYSVAVPSTTGFFLPEINGPSQSRLRGLVDYDVRYVVSIRIWNKESASDTDPVPGFSFMLYLNDNPALRPPEPPAFPDAGSDVVAAVGQTVDLDARRTFDAYNIGFDPLDPQVYLKDEVYYSWEWLSGPSRLEPVKPDPARQPWLAQITPDVIGTYEYRVFVTTSSNPIPHSDTMTVSVLSELPPNHAPRAVITAPSEPVVVGETVTLDASSSSDADGDALHYRWRQTDEVGGSIPFDMLASTFQPLGGLQAVQSQWQALSPGTYYFILLVDDGQASSSATTTVEVVAAAAAGETAVADASDGGDTAAPATAPIVPPGACGAGLTPMLLAPLALLLLRGRMR